eukprot:364397-Chlamydomonas_euryale.AAC.25
MHEFGNVSVCALGISRAGDAWWTEERVMRLALPRCPSAPHPDLPFHRLSEQRSAAPSLSKHLLTKKSAAAAALADPGFDGFACPSRNQRFGAVCVRGLLFGAGAGAVV